MNVKSIKPEEHKVSTDPSLGKIKNYLKYHSVPIQAIEGIVTILSKEKK